MTAVTGRKSSLHFHHCRFSWHLWRKHRFFSYILQALKLRTVAIVSTKQSNLNQDQIGKIRNPHKPVKLCARVHTCVCMCVCASMYFRFLATPICRGKSSLNCEPMSITATERCCWKQFLHPAVDLCITHTHTLKHTKTHT